MSTAVRGSAATVVLLLALASAGLASTVGPRHPPRSPPPSRTPARPSGSTAASARKCGRRSPCVTDLVQRDPDEGKPATERTEVRVAYDDNALYIGARLFDSQPSRIVRRRSRRDADTSSDLLRVYLDPHHDHKTGVMLTVSAAGSLADAWLSNDFERDTSWDGVWDAAVTVDDRGWTVEMRIPFSQLRFAPGGPPDVGPQRQPLHPARERRGLVGARPQDRFEAGLGVRAPGRDSTASARRTTSSCCPT